MADALLQIEGLSKRFGGIVATDDVTLSIPTGELHAIIGPNGAGKTTLIAQLTGQLAPDQGHVRFAGEDITAVPTWQRSLIGIARSFQITSLLLDLSVIDNVSLAVQAHAGHSFQFWRNARKDAALTEPAMAALARVGLRQLELAMALAGRPRMLLLDEPMAGKGPDESARMVALLRELKKEYTILLIEHDMEAVFALADRSSVLVYGRVIATGKPEDIRANAEVRQAYLGDDGTGSGHHG